MLPITIPATEKFDATTEEFIIILSDPKTIQLEHSLISVSKWEQIYKKPFMTTELKGKMFTDYVKCMTIGQPLDDYIYDCLTPKNKKEIADYIQDSATATWISDDVKKKNKGKSHEIITSELIYYWMISLQIPKEMEKWHLNRLLTLIEVCNIKNTPPEKMSKKDLYARNRELNKARKAKLHSKG